MNALANLPLPVQPVSLLYQAFVGVRQAQPTLGLTGWSRLLSCSEGELQAARMEHEKVWPLEEIFSLFYLLPSLGEVEIQVFNALGWAKYEGHFNAPDLCLDDPHQLGLEFKSSHFQLQLNLEKWYWGCAVEDFPEGKSRQQSLQFFTTQGARFLKISRLPPTNALAWQQLVDQFAREVTPTKPLFDSQPNASSFCSLLDTEQLRKEWRLMSHSRQVPILLRRHQTSYLNLLQHLDNKCAREVSLSALAQLLNKQAVLPAGASKPQLKISYFTEGCSLSVQGELQPPRLQHQQLCIAYAKGCLHCEPQRLETAYVVRKPQGDGWVTALEVFSDHDQLVLQIQEAKSAFQPENLLYRELFQALT